MPSTDTHWEAAFLRVALFPTQALPRDVDIFTQLTGESPDSQEDRLKEGVRRQTGKLDDASLLVLLNPIRLDIITGTSLELGVVPPDQIPPRFTFGPFRERLEWFSRFILDWLPKWSCETTRVSFIARLLASADDLAGAYRILARNLNSVHVSDGMRDLRFRVNWRTETNRVSEGYYNRVCTWSALRATVGIFESARNVQESYFAQLELDINTPAETAEPLPHEALAPIFKDLFGLGIENAEAGERP